MRSQCEAELVADAAGGCFVWRNAGFASLSCAVYPGSPRLGSADPGLYSATPLGLVCGGAERAAVQLDACEGVKEHSR
jgi:hypothetical protein